MVENLCHRCEAREVLKHWAASQTTTQLQSSQSLWANDWRWQTSWINSTQFYFRSGQKVLQGNKSGGLQDHPRWCWTLLKKMKPNSIRTFWLLKACCNQVSGIFFTVQGSNGITLEILNHQSCTKKRATLPLTPATSLWHLHLQFEECIQFCLRGACSQVIDDKEVFEEDFMVSFTLFKLTWCDKSGFTCMLSPTWSCGSSPTERHQRVQINGQLNYRMSLNNTPYSHHFT